MSGDEGFFARWSRRKTLQRGDAVADLTAGDARAASKAELRNDATAPSVPGSKPPPVAAQHPPLPSPTMDDVAQLTPVSDFSRYVGAGVDAAVQRAALKKLFSDPHFNVMDGLDIYIGDYNTPDPIPDAMLRRLRQSNAMRLFDAPDDATDAAPLNEAGATAAGSVVEAASEASPDGAPAPELSQSSSTETVRPPPESSSDEDTALRLQPDDAADATGAGSHRPGPRA